MSKIDELITELCPDGIRYEELQDLFDVKNGYTPSKKVSEYWSNGSVPWFRMEDIRKNGRVLNDSIQHVSESAVKKGVLFPEYSIVMSTTATIGEHALITVPFLMNQQMTAFSIKPGKKDVIDIKFFFYVCFSIGEWCRKNVNTSSLAIVSTGQLKKFKIPIPPLEVQKEIVNILDKFTQLEAELSAELDARREQYEYYREELMTFGNDVQHKLLGEVGEVTKLAGYEFTAHIKYANEGKIIALRGLNVKHGRLDLSSVKYIDQSNFAKLTRSKLYVNDMLFTYVGTIGQVALIDEDDKYYLAPNVARIRFTDKEINPVFMRYYFQTQKFTKKQINRYLSESSMKNLTMENIRKFQVPLPPLDEQDRIVELLDKFNALVGDISIGIPAELSARRQQYEYYRTKLLTFQEIPA